jgi:hypothetical protein
MPMTSKRIAFSAEQGVDLVRRHDDDDDAEDLFKAPARTGLFRPVQEKPGQKNLRLALVLAFPISVLSGLLGIGRDSFSSPPVLFVAHPPYQHTLTLLISYILPNFPKCQPSS